MDSKSAEYIKRSERAASEIATWPKWMQHNLKPLKVTVSGIYRPSKGGSEVALSKGDRVPPGSSGGGAFVKAASKEKRKK